MAEPRVPQLNTYIPSIPWLTVRLVPPVHKGSLVSIAVSLQNFLMLRRIQYDNFLLIRAPCLAYHRVVVHKLAL